MPCRLLLGLRGYQEKPPSTRNIEPVLKLDASDAKNSAPPTISGGSPARCSDRLPKGLCAGSSRFHDLLTSVRKGPAIKVLTRTFGPSARAKPSVIALSPAFDEAYG